jgi:beta-xylosidase
MHVFPLTLLALMLLLAACRAPERDLELAAAEATYTNPVGGDSLLMGDPFVLKHDGQYYLFGTTDPNRGFRVYTSPDLVRWQEAGFAYERSDTTWGQPPFWAPEVLHYRDRFYMTYSARDPASGHLLTALAVSDRPEGPYRDLHAPWFDLGHSAIDSHLFVDDDGQPYVYFSKNGMQDGYSFGIIYGAPVERDLRGLAAAPVLLMQAEQDWERINYAENRANEGSFVLKHEGRYYMTYSANHTFRPGYGIGVATADAPLGPWTKDPDNPLAGTDRAVGYSGAGHNAITTSPDGTERFMVYHTHADPDHPENQQRTVNIDRIRFEEGQLVLDGPTRSPQPLPSGALSNRDAP